MLVFRFKRSVPVSYPRQGYIYFKSLCFRSLSLGERDRLTALCAKAGREYAEALKEFVTTGKGATEICLKHHLSRSTLERAVRRYYILFPEDL